MKDVSDKRLLLEVMTRGALTSVYPLTGEGSITISGGADQGVCAEGGESRAVPSTFTLKQNYPNPFNPTTAIDFGVPTNSRVELRVYDLLGREVMKSRKGTMSREITRSMAISADWRAVCTCTVLRLLE